MEQFNGYALILDKGDGKYTMTTIHKTAECAMTNGLGADSAPFGIFNDYRVVALVPVSFEDDGKKNLHICFGDQELVKQEMLKHYETWPTAE